MKIKGTIVHGKKIGRTLGFPTANIDSTTPVWDANGVYAAWVEIDGQKLPCMVNIGRHPTLPEGEKTIEAHIFAFDEDVYGKEALLETVAFLRGEVKFSSLEELRLQLERDAQRSREILNIDNPPGIK